MNSPSGKYWLSDNYVCLDFETTLDPTWEYKGDIVLACWQLGPGHPAYKEGIKSRWGGRYEQQELLEDINKSDFIVAHNSKFELHWLSKCGLSLYDVLAWCTQIGEFIILGNREGSLHLGDVAKKYGLEGKDDLVSQLIKGGVCPSQIPKELLEKYCRKDVSLTNDLFLIQREILKEQDQLQVALTRNIFTPLLVQIEANGMFISEPGLHKQLREVTSSVTEVGSSLDKLTGGINVNSPKQLGSYLYDTLGFEELKDKKGNPIRTPKGGRKTGADIIGALEASTEAQVAFKEAAIRGIILEDELDFITKALACKEEDGGILHGSLNQTVVATHRLSSNGGKRKIQLQNIARSRKKYFGPRHEGWEIFEVDEAQIEFRAAGHYGRDERCRNDIWDGFDVHTFSAIENKLFRPDGKPDRQSAKEVTFKPLFYGGRYTEWFKKFRERYPGIAEIQEEWIYGVLKNKQLRIETGLIFYWPECHIGRGGYIVPSTEICNYGIQSICGADVLPISAVLMWHIASRLGLNGFPICTVHDSVIWEIPKEERGTFFELACLTYLSGVHKYMYYLYKLDFYTPLGIGMKVGPRWSKGEEIKIDWLDGEYRIREEMTVERFLGEIKQ